MTSHRCLLFVLAISVYLVGATEFMLSAIMFPLANAFNVQALQISWLISAYAFSYALAAPVVGFFSDKMDKRKMLLVAMLFISIDSIAITFAPNLLIALILRVFGGVASAALVPITFAFISDVIDENKQAIAMGYVMLGMTLGIITGPILAGVMTQYFSWRMPFIFMAVGGLLVLFISIKVLPSVASSTVKQGSFNIFKQGMISKFIIAKGIWNGITVCLFLLAGEILRSRYQFNSAMTGSLMGLFGIGLIIGNSIVAKVVSYKVSELSLVLAIIRLLFMIILLFISDWLTLIGDCFCLFGFGVLLGLISPISTSLLARLNVNNKGLILSISESFNNIVLLLAIPLFSWLISEGRVLTSTILISLLFSIVIFFITRVKVAMR
ncbi:MULTISPECIES: MFS transporter [Providencia]|uniref:MFS transporter n=1 Tax=Providencia TaxID=586 RepID=UPI00197DF483|nr:MULTISPECIES: MFS transporter [Providencia]MBN4866807.1 MFS transporter [Providencia stuartii]MBN4875921.1 MFS transporter [Providencia stuartii]MBN4880821.1 MFS transporter [Providencia stuartii]MBN4885121.1 MFS transporter [Providencia stuartii]